VPAQPLLLGLLLGSHLLLGSRLLLGLCLPSRRRCWACRCWAWLHSCGCCAAGLAAQMHPWAPAPKPFDSRARLPARPCPAPQGVMLDIVAMILIVIEDNLPFGLMWTPWSDLFYALSFWFIFLLVIYCLFFNFMCAACPAPPACSLSATRCLAAAACSGGGRAAQPHPPGAAAALAAAGAALRGARRPPRRRLTRLPLPRRRGWYCEIPLMSEGVYMQIEQAESIGAS
jgi:hypothetical protein